MSENNPNASTSPGNGSGVPRAVWIGGGALVVAAAAMGGALISRSIPSTPPSSPQVATAPAPVPSTLPPAPNDGVPPPAQVQPSVSGPVPAAALPKPAAVAVQAGIAPTSPTPQASVCASCGVVESVVAVREKGQGTGLGAVTGGVLGGVVGNQVGGGNGKTALTVLGAIGGGLAGNEVEKRARAVTHYEVRVRMDNGKLRTFERAEAVAVGTPVNVNGGTLRIANRRG